MHTGDIVTLLSGVGPEAGTRILDAKVFVAQAIFESEISATAAKEVKEELANEKTKLKEDISAEEKIEGEGNKEKEEKIGSIQKEIEEAAEKIKQALISLMRPFIRSLS